MLRALVPIVVTTIAVSACTDNPPPTASPTIASLSSLSASGALVVNASADTTAQNETPLAVNPLNPQNIVTGANDWNYNDGCSVNASFDGGKSWTPTLPNGFIPGVTKYTNDPAVAGTGPGIFGGDPAIAFGPDGTAYYACYTYIVTANSSLRAQLLLSRSTDGGRTWLKGGTAEPLTVVAQWDNATGKTKGSAGQFQDHDAIHVASDGTIYVTWAQFSGNGTHSPVFVAVSHDGGTTFAAPNQITTGTVRNNQDQRIVTDPRTGYAYLTFDNGVQGGDGTVMYYSVSTDRGASWSTPIQFAAFQNPVCLHPPYCFTPSNVGSGPFRGPGSYPVPAFDPVRGRLYVAYSDIVGGQAQLFLTYATAQGGNLSSWSRPAVIAPGNAGHRLNVEMSIEPTSGRMDVISDDGSYSNNALIDVTYGVSRDGGSTWATQRVTRSGFDPTAYGVPSAGSPTGFRPFIGDYNGIVSLPTSAVFTWTDVGKTYGAVPDNLEIFFGSVTP
ncbi:MAG: sialidase family protein [Gemmatimonadaceae bacterium]